MFRTLWPLAASSVFLACGAPSAATTVGSGTPPMCSVVPSTFGAAELVCPLAPSAQSQTLNLRVTFNGVHDDSSAALAARLDGKGLACAPGSRSRIEGDGEGDTLTCRIVVPPAPATRDLRVQLVWHHAEPNPYTLERE